MPDDEYEPSIAFSLSQVMSSEVGMTVRKPCAAL